MVFDRALRGFVGLMLATAAVAESVFLIAPAPDAEGTDLAVVWIQGANYGAVQYNLIAQQFQLQASLAGYKAWIGIPDFMFSTPNPLTIGSHIESAMEKITANGFEGDNWFLAAHSLGGVMTQDFLMSGSTSPDASLFKGQILMSSVLLRDSRSVQESDGTTLYDFNTPTLTMGGTKDGLMRITRVAESYYHQVTNISPSQANMFPVEALSGVAHYQFAGGVPPSFVQKNDLKGDISDESARSLVGTVMTDFIDSIIRTEGFASTSQETSDFMAPFLEAMVQEGSAVMKEPCNDKDIINVASNTCIKGSPWVQERALKTLVGELADPQVTLTNNDNFHPAGELFPYHHPELTFNCDTQSGPCDVTHISVTQNSYEWLNELDLGKTPIAATSMRVKLKSSQIIHIASREPDADFDLLDMQLTECQAIDQEVQDWAYSMADQTAKDLYDSVGEKLVQTKDVQQENGGLWIIQELKWKKSKDKTQMDNTSVACTLPEDEKIPIFKSMHYCKLLSPFRALEWIYVDSQYAFGGYQPQETVELKFLSE